MKVRSLKSQVAGRERGKKQIVLSMAGVGVIGALRQISSKFHLLCLQSKSNIYT